MKMPGSEEEKIEKLADYMLEVVAECFEEDDVTTSDVIAALFVVLGRSLRGIRKLQEPEERFPNALIIRQALQDLLVEFGRVPS
jgi:hypothetical protein